MFQSYTLPENFLLKYVPNIASVSIQAHLAHPWGDLAGCDTLHVRSRAPGLLCGPMVSTRRLSSVCKSKEPSF